MISERAKAVKETVESSLLMLPGVTGIAVSNPEERIIIYVESEEYAEAVPKTLAGVEVEVRVTGRIFALGCLPCSDILSVAEDKGNEVVDRKGVVRPLVGGISVGNIYITAGTLGIIKRMLVDGKLVPLILSNAHVLAMDMGANFVEEKTPIIQPGLADGGTEENRIGELLGYWPIVFNDPNAENYADAAIGVLDEGVEYLEEEILSEDNMSTYTIDLTPEEVAAGDVIRKSGRTTGVTYGTVDSPSATMTISYTPDRTKWAAMRDVIVVRSEEAFILPGDSGSAADKDGKFVGLCFAASEDGTWGIICKAKYLYEAPPPTKRPSPIAGLFTILGIIGLMALPAVLKR